MNWSGVKLGLYEVGTIISGVAKDLTACDTVKGDFSKLEKIGDTLADPWSAAWTMGTNLVRYHSEIWNESMAAISDYDNSKWYDMGVNMGEAATHLILGADKVSIKITNITIHRGVSLMNLQPQKRNVIALTPE